ncbi:MAG: hypothetical protein QOI48_1125 [Solirubrobacteraceae bacterium]|jgi:hypothetical protein|nr:hypothetical protein [Solirubrobacteraceae bacterium]
MTPPSGPVHTARSTLAACITQGAGASAPRQRELLAALGGLRQAAGQRTLTPESLPTGFVR